jgi:two-component system alkaline phosphatase synthesis response regulator PhoP
MSFFSDQQRKTLRILFAEDHEPTRNFLAAVIRKAGYLLDVTTDGRTALQLFEKSSDAYDVVVTDHEMPHLNGLELVQKLRAARFPGSVVVVSGGLSSENAAAYANLEVDQVLSKPISGRALIEAIRAVEPGNKLQD